MLENIEKDNLTKQQNKLLSQVFQTRLPDKKNEAWKYLNISDVYKKHKIEKIQSCAAISSNHDNNIQSLIQNDQYFHMVIENGIIIHQCCSVGLEKTLSDQDYDMDPMVNLSRALTMHEIDLNVTKQLGKPLFIHFISNDKFACQHIALNINVVKNIQTSIFYQYHSTSTNASSINISTKINLDKSSKISYDQKQDYSNNTALISTHDISVILQENATFNAFSCPSSLLLDRKSYRVHLNGKLSSSVIKGLQLVSKNAISDCHIYITHNASDTHSDVKFNGVVNNKGMITFNAKARIEKGLKNIQAYQHNANIQLASTATINTKPELEIYSDDVACSHGTTIGQLDDDALFYMLSRGISLKEAKKLLLEGFINRIIEELDREFDTNEKYLDNARLLMNLILD